MLSVPTDPRNCSQATSEGEAYKSLSSVRTPRVCATGFFSSTSGFPLYERQVPQAQPHTCRLNSSNHCKLLLKEGGRVIKSPEPRAEGRCPTSQFLNAGAKQQQRKSESLTSSISLLFHSGEEARSPVLVQRTNKSIHHDVQESMHHDAQECIIERFHGSLT